MAIAATRLTPIAIAIALLSANATAQNAQAIGQNSPQAAEVNLPAVEVVGRRTGGSYHAEEASGTKTELPLREVPQSVRIMSRQTIDDLGAVRVDDVLDFVGGISRQNNFGGLWDNIAIRGLSGDINNGMPLLLNGFSANRGFNAPRDTANIERIEFLKGPSAALYGTSEPGGTVNIVTKRPLWKPAHSLETYAGSHDFYRVAADSTGPISETLAYRLNAAVEDRNSFRDHVESKRYFIAPALAWKASRNTRIDYSGEFLRHEAPLDRGIAAVDNQLGAIPRERFLGEPADGNVKVNNQTHQLVAEHLFNEIWSAKLGLSYKKNSLEGFSTEPQPTLQTGQSTLRRQRRYRDYASDDTTLQAEAVGRFKSGGISHEVLIGSEMYWLDANQLMLRTDPTATPYAIDVLNPVYGQPQPVPGPNTNTSEDQKGIALYLQDTLSLGERWRLLGGVRFDRVEQSLFNRITGRRTEQNPTATSPRIGVSYLPDTQWTLFANLGKSFRPNNGASAAGASFSPEQGRAFEIGAKWENTEKTLGATVALYNIKKKNVLTSDPANTGFSITAGELRSRGMDADLTGQITQNWRINASLSYIDATVLRDNTLEVGGRLLNIPRINGSLLLMHEWTNETSQQFGLGGGFTYSGKRLGEARTRLQAALGTPSFDLPAYTVAKIAAYWRYSPTLRFSLDIDNVFDKTYYNNSFQRTWVTPGAPRTITLGMQAKF
ncbi:MAG TPA: TonB-dependent siderophore receptor [Noviherbaspirillum sp.]|jgi:iron complex outermembrane receptor protein|uniref:TonB-dependent siderophore receptor n=1 Tax=Noviherbaspirillum sp. TaxID=1926288 RepID=UPI002DDD59B2|nr:TonB-dependent siderophore receptor [Noviherbaspirillum sp.]HEV2612951.1 TonB-dependent siderophore receptor [Noviherbaspirillum sp.]